MVQSHISDYSLLLPFVFSALQIITNSPWCRPFLPKQVKQDSERDARAKDRARKPTAKAKVKASAKSRAKQEQVSPKGNGPKDSKRKGAK